MDGAVRELLTQLPLADAVWELWSTITTEPFLQDLFDRHRGRCYEKVLSFPTPVHLVAEALCQHHGRGHQAFLRADEQETLDVSIPALYGKLRRLPIPLSEAFLAQCTARLRPFRPQRGATEAPPSLAAFRIVVFDGKTLQRAAQRLKATRGLAGQGLAGRALVGLELQTGLLCAFSAHPDGHANEASLVPSLRPQIRAQLPGTRLGVGDRQFGDLVQMTRRAADGDHFVVRHHPKTPFVPDPSRPARTGQDRCGRAFTEEGGWLRSGRQGQERYVRRVVLERPGQETVVLLTDLLDGALYPAEDVLEVYRERWGIERVFQQVSEVFHLLHLIGSTPAAAIFQCGLCMVLYHLLQVVRALVAETQQRPVSDISSEQLFLDLRRELIALHTLADRREIAEEIPRLAASREDLGAHVRSRLASAWSRRWLKAKRKKYQPPRAKPKAAGSHVSLHRVLQAAKKAKAHDV